MAECECGRDHEADDAVGHELGSKLIDLVNDFVPRIGWVNVIYVFGRAIGMLASHMEAQQVSTGEFRLILSEGIATGVADKHSEDSFPPLDAVEPSQLN